MYKVAGVVTVLFFAFIVWVIFMANTGQNTIFFDFVRSIPYGDKLGHLLLFGTLVLGANIGTRFKSMNVWGGRVYIGTAAVTLFVIAEELSQSFVPARTMDVMDLCADVVGIAAFTALSATLSKRIGTKGEAA